ncbi:hypothetical protein CEXT_217481 [Caerostris extrusa]|uniref:Uncharacterized protein n=1 Tax=Caerostris extrusa TaxID=172846 RepID=A0AAV4XSE0_CAEEX|nr:hypothetical protein CEXT_217481 [Caerostris extrusa]
MQPFIQKEYLAKRFIAKLWQPSPTDLAPPFKPTLPPKLTINIAKEKDLKFPKLFKWPRPLSVLRQPFPSTPLGLQETASDWTGAASSSLQVHACMW